MNVGTGELHVSVPDRDPVELHPLLEQKLDASVIHLQLDASVVDLSRRAHLYYGPSATIEEITGVVNTSIAMISSSTLTVSLNATQVTDGAVVFNANYSPGDTEAATPTADNVVQDEDMIHVAQSGLNALAGTATLYLKLRAKP